MSDRALAAGPLVGRRIVVTRAAEQAATLVAGLRARGAEPIVCPLITIEPPTSYAPLDAALATLDDFDWVIFTSSNAVAAVAERLAVVRPRPTSRPAVQLAAVGPATAAAVTAALWPPALVPAVHRAEGLLSSIGAVRGQRILLPLGDRALPTLADGLRAAGAVVVAVVAYRTVPAAGASALLAALDHGPVAAICFTSPSAVEQALIALGPDGARRLTGDALRERPAIFCIGPTTAAAAHRRGLTTDAVAAEWSAAGLVTAIETWFVARGDEADHPRSAGRE